MKCRYGVMTLMVLAMAGAGAGRAAAQGHVEVVENVLFSSNSVDDPVRTLTFGFGSDYSDSTDFNKGEQILPPFFPPEGFFAYFGIKDKTGSEDFGTKDVRGVPDSVAAGALEHFSQQWNIYLKRGSGQDITISFQFPLMRGIDSVNFQSIQAGANFNHTFTDRGQVKIPNSLITSLRMTVYYNYERALSVPVASRNRGPAALSLYPNPARTAHSVTLAGELPAGSRVELVDIYGSVVENLPLEEARENASIALPNLPAGTYMVRVLDRASSVIQQGGLVVAE